MAMLRVQSFSVSIDGFDAGPGQSLQNPLGVGGLVLHEWAFATRTFQRMFGKDGGATRSGRFAGRGSTLNATHVVVKKAA
ncbi:MAG: hypothetical protein ACREUK_07510 [Burkholderiales bacterium]